jgi:hypothetical protein
MYLGMAIPTDKNYFNRFTCDSKTKITLTINYLGFEVLTAVVLKSCIFCDIAPCVCCLLHADFLLGSLLGPVRPSVHPSIPMALQPLWTLGAFSVS